MAKKLKFQAPDGEIGLPELEPRAYRFVCAVADGESLTAAYRAAYGISGPVTPYDHQRASGLARRDDCAAWLSWFAHTATKRINESREQYLQDLHRLQELAESKGNLSVAIQALKARGDALGFKESTVNQVKGTSPGDVLSRIRAQNPALAAALERSTGGDAAVRDGENGPIEENQEIPPSVTH